MKLVVLERFDGPAFGVFPVFPKGTALEVVGKDDECPHWFPCIINGMGFWTPDIYMEDGVLNRDYNPTSLLVEQGQAVTLIDLVFEWLLVKDESGKEGWLPARVVTSVVQKP